MFACCALRQQLGASGWQDTVDSEAEDLAPDFVTYVNSLEAEDLAPDFVTHVNTLAVYGTLATRDCCAGSAAAPNISLSELVCCELPSTPSRCS